VCGTAEQREARFCCTSLCSAGQAVFSRKSLDFTNAVWYTEKKFCDERRRAMEYNGYLLSGDIPVAQVQHGQIIPLDRARMPLYLSAGGKFENWLVSRAIDCHRPNSRILKKVLRLTDSGDIAAVLRAHAATITDNYWIRSTCEESLSYEKIRFKEDTFAEIALTGSFSSYSRDYEKAQLAAGTPELTNIGSYEKCWRIKDGSWWLYKSGTPLERFSELFIARLGELLGFSMAEYLSDGEFVKTPDFTRGTLNYEPAEAIVGDEESYTINYDRLTALCPSFGKQYLDILYMDALCFNMDRHTQNYGVLRDRSTGEVVSMAPNFDNNIALISRGYGTDASQTNGLLIDLFVELLEEQKLEYQCPVLDEASIVEITRNTLPDETIDRNYVVKMTLERSQRIKRKIKQMQRISCSDMKFS